MIHPAAEVHTKSIGPNTHVWQFSVILEGAVIGDNCNINCHTFIENQVVIGNNVTLKSGVYIWDGIRVEDNVFIGPNVTFVNDKLPRSKQYPGEYLGAWIKAGASLGAAATILGGLTIGENAMIGAGSVVTKNVLPHSLVAGNPARPIGWVDEQGRKLQKHATEPGIFSSESGIRYQQTSNGLIKL